MRNLLLPSINTYRRTGPDIIAYFGSTGDSTHGIFSVPSCIDLNPMLVIATSDLGWDHVSVSCKDRIPLWTEMQQIKDLFFKPEEVVMQLHVAEKDHINFASTCLHLWRPLGESIPLPPKSLV